MEQDHRPRIALAPGGIESVVGPLRLIFWGGLLCAFDFKFNGFDIFNDGLGALLVAWGVLRLGCSQIHERYRLAMLFVQVVALLYLIEAINAYLQYEFPRPLAFLLHVYGIAKMVATVVFCMAMRWLCIATGLTRSERSWKTTEILFAVIYFIPWGFLHLVWIVCLFTRQSFSFELGASAVLILVVFFIPLIHLFVSTSRMRTEAQSICHQDNERPPDSETFSLTDSTN